jgi:hypothetical protein
MKPVKLSNGSHSTKMCHECGNNPVTHRLTGTYYRHGYCLECAKKISERENNKDNGMSEGEYRATGYGRY